MNDPAHMNTARQAARAFRVILDAVARPGRVFTLPRLIDPVEPAYATTLSVLLSLGDHLTSIHISEILRTAEIEKCLRFHTGSQLLEAPGQADFAVLDAADAEHGLEVWKRGTPEYPDQSVTLLIQTTSLTQGEAVQFSGPGMQAPVTLRIADIKPSFWKARDAVNGLFPLGVDMLFVTPHDILGCPRSTRVSLRGDI